FKLLPMWPVCTLTVPGPPTVRRRPSPPPAPRHRSLNGLPNHLPPPLRRPANEPSQVAAVGVELAAGEGPVGVGQGARGGLREAEADQGAHVLLLGEVAVFDRALTGPGDLLGQFGHGEGLVAAELVDLASVSAAPDHRRRGRGVVAPGSGALPPLAGAAEQHPMLERGSQVLRVVLDVPTIAQEGVRDSGFANRLLRPGVLDGELHRAAVRPEDARVRQQADARGARRVDYVAMLSEPLPDFVG